MAAAISSAVKPSWESFASTLAPAPMSSSVQSCEGERRVVRAWRRRAARGARRRNCAAACGGAWAWRRARG